MSSNQSGSPHSYIPNTDADRRLMLQKIGVAVVEELFGDIPERYRAGHLNLPPALTEMELRRAMSGMAARNVAANSVPCFLGGGSYSHFIPSVVGYVTSRGEFSTAYTPYQPEISQGTLGATYDFQSMMCELTGMDVANTGMYDGASAMAEAALMAARLTARKEILALGGVQPSALEVLRTYCSGQGLAVTEVPRGTRPVVNSDTAAVVVQSPNYEGRIEELGDWAEAAHTKGSLMIGSVNNPMSLGMFKPPGHYDADIVVGEAACLGNAPSFGGPYVGMFTTRDKYVRQMPGRIVGKTADTQGRPGYVLTLQTREQHIRREKATSNICTAEALVALGAAVSLALLGQRIKDVAELCYHKAHYAAQKISEIPGYNVSPDGIFFNEFVAQCPRPPQEVNDNLWERGIVGGIDVSDRVPNGLLLAVTEMNTRHDIDSLVEGLKSL